MVIYLQVFVGIGAKRVRELFDAAKKKAPCIIFLDEIDAVGGKRTAKDRAELKQTLNQARWMYKINCPAHTHLLVA